MKNIIHITGIIILMIFITGCNDDFMERYPKTSISPEIFFNTEEDLQMYIYGLYNFGGLGSITDDAYNTTDDAVTTGVSEIKTIMTGTPSSRTVTSGWTWEQLRKINFFLANFEKANLTQAKMDHYEGIARFFRARFYYDKVLRYSDVPWIDFVLESDSKELFAAQNPRAFVVDKIMEDLEFAATHVNKSGKSGEVNQWVVKAIYARIALFEGSWRRYHPELNLIGTANHYFEIAAAQSKNIIDEGGFEVYNTGKPMEDYRTLFTSLDLTVNREVILPIIYNYNVRSNGWGSGVFGDYETCPTRNIVQTYLMADGTYYSSQPNWQTKQYVEEFTDRDPRIYQTFTYPGWVLRYNSTYSQGLGVHLPRLGKNFTGYHQIKGFMNTENSDYETGAGMDWPLIRYAEVLLTYAEARAELGVITTNDLDISVNLLRQRAGMPDMLFSPAVDPEMARRYPAIASNGLLLEIRRERQVEFALEGYRFNDMMRWAAGKLLESPAKGMYFPGLGKYDLNGDGIPDIILIDGSESVPAVKEENELGVPLVYYRVGMLGEMDVDAFLENGTSGCLEHIATMGTFEEPKHYYRPVPYTQVVLNPQLYQQFGWE